VVIHIRGVKNIPGKTRFCSGCIDRVNKTGNGKLNTSKKFL
jgi:uncharacterized protein YlaI